MKIFSNFSLYLVFCLKFFVLSQNYWAKNVSLQTDLCVHFPEKQPLDVRSDSRQDPKRCNSMSGEHEIQRLDVGSRKPPKNDLLLVTRCREKETRGPANFLLHYTRCRERVARAFRATPSRHRVEYHYSLRPRYARASGWLSFVM